LPASPPHQISTEGRAALEPELRALETKGPRDRPPHPHRARNVAVVVETRTFGSRVIYERYGRARDESD
jgi:hypothetical protein